MTSTKQIAIYYFLALCLIATTALAAESVSVAGDKSDIGSSTIHNEIYDLIRMNARAKAKQQGRRQLRGKKEKNVKNIKNVNPKPPPTPRPTRVADAETWPPTDSTGEPTSFPTTAAHGLAMTERRLFFNDPVGENAYYLYEGEVDETAPITSNVIVSNVNSCEGIKELCEDSKSSNSIYKKFRMACSLLEAVDFLTFNTLDSKAEFTAFLPTNEAFRRLFEEVYDYRQNDRIPKEWIQNFLAQHIIKGNKRLGSDIFCKDRLPVVKDDSINWPTVQCKTTILNGFVPFIRGNRNRGNYYLPRITNPDDPTLLCKDVFYELDDVILQRDPK